VTSLNRAEAANFGRDEHMGHDARYDRADEFMEVVLGHWNTWEDDALILDKANSRFADPAKVHRLDHGPVLPVARPVQRAAVAAGPSGADPGRAVRPGPDVRRKMGRNRIRDPSLARGRQEGICLVQSGRRGRRARSRSSKKGHAHQKSQKATPSHTITATPSVPFRKARCPHRSE